MRRAVILCVLWCAVALAVRLVRVGAHEPWLDEGSSWRIATAENGLELVRNNNTPPLYYGLLRAWVSAAGASPFALRFPSALAGALAAGAIYFLARRVGGDRAGSWAAAFATLSPIHVHYSQEARAYALTTLLLPVFYLLTIGAAGGRWAAVRATAAAAMAAVAHAGGLVGVLTAAPVLLSAAPRPRPWRRWLVAALVATMAFGAWATWSFRSPTRAPAGGEWLEGRLEERAPAIAMLRSLEALLLGGQVGVASAQMKGVQSLEFPGLLRFLGLFAAAALAAAALWPGEVRRGGSLALALVAPLAALWALSWFGTPYLVGRYDLVAFPVLPVLLAFGGERLRARLPAVATVLLVGLAAVMTLKLAAQLTLPAPDTFHPTARILDGALRDGDVLVFTDLRGAPLLYQLGRLGWDCGGRTCESEAAARRVALFFFPDETRHHAGDLDARRLSARPEAAADDVLAMLAARGSSASTLWVVLGAWASNPQGQIASTRLDALLLNELKARGLRPLWNSALGIGEYRAGS